MTTVRHALNAKNRIPWKSVVSGASNIIVFKKTGANDEKNYERNLRKKNVPPMFSKIFYLKSETVEIPRRYRDTSAVRR